MDNLPSSAGVSGHAGFSLASVGSCVNNAVPSTSTVTGGTSESAHVCGICQQIFQCKADLLTHTQRMHRGVVMKPYKCQTCGKCFANASYLSQHQRIHLGLKPYRCQLCDRRFTQLCHLQQHMRTHTGEKPYGCRHAGCTKAFSQLSNLQSHMRSHMADRPFRCHSCYKCFGDEAALRDHIPRHNETKHLKTKICTVCGKSYAQETYLARHMARHQAGVGATSSTVGNSFPLPAPPQPAMSRLEADIAMVGFPFPGSLQHALLTEALQQSCSGATHGLFDADHFKPDGPST